RDHPRAAARLPRRRPQRGGERPRRAGAPHVRASPPRPAPGDAGARPRRTLPRRRLAARAAHLPRPREARQLPARGPRRGRAGLLRLPPQDGRLPVLPGQPRRPPGGPAGARPPRPRAPPALLPVQRRPAPAGPRKLNTPFLARSSHVPPPAVLTRAGALPSFNVGS